MAAAASRREGGRMVAARTGRGEWRVARRGAVASVRARWLVGYRLVGSGDACDASMPRVRLVVGLQSVAVTSELSWGGVSQLS